jgi:DNA-binding CsgD family transcriptional regulator
MIVERQQRLLGFFHGELGPLIGQSLASHADPSSDRLSRRLRATLACLLEGDGEKHVASRLGLSQATIHQYVTALYRHSNAGSRAQLLATVMSRTGRGRREQSPASRKWNRPVKPQAPLDRRGPVVPTKWRSK